MRFFKVIAFWESVKHPSGVRCYSCYYYQDLPFPWLSSRLWEDWANVMPSLRPSKDIRRSRELAWLVGTEAIAIGFPPWKPRPHSSFFLSVPTSSVPGLPGELVIVLNSPMETLCYSTPNVPWDRDYVCSPSLPSPKMISICTISVNQEPSSGILCMALLINT